MKYISKLFRYHLLVTLIIRNARGCRITPVHFRECYSVFGFCYSVLGLCHSVFKLFFGHYLFSKASDTIVYSYEYFCISIGYKSKGFGHKSKGFGHKSKGSGRLNKDFGR